MSKIIDAHCHYTVPEYYEILLKNGAELEDGFPIPDWSVEAHLELMDEAGFEWTMMSVSSPHPYFQDDAEGRGLVRKFNEKAAAVKREYPDRFGFGACLPLPNVDAAIEEAKNAIDELGADSIKFASNSRGMYMGDPAMAPLFDYLNEKKCVINIHPHRPAPQQEGIFTAGPVPLFEFLCDTTRAVLNMIANGVIERCPDIKVIVPHCGSFLPNIYDRFLLIREILVPKGLMQPIDVEKSFSKLYFDLSGNPAPHLLEFLLTVTTPDKIMYGSDFPFTAKPLVLRNLKRLTDMLDEKPNLTPYKDQFMYETARKLFKRP